jgi:hypothetical protein
MFEGWDRVKGRKWKNRNSSLLTEFLLEAQQIIVYGLPIVVYLLPRNLLVRQSPTSNVIHNPIRRGWS